MKNWSFIVLLMFLTTSGLAQISTADFVTTWRTYNPGVSGDSSVFIETDPNYNYNYDIDWNNDGVFDALGVVGDFTINYPDTGTYTIRIRGQFERILFGGATFVVTNDNDKLIAINQWGNQAWKSLEWAFMNCRNNYYLATDTPNLGQTTTLNKLFFNNSHFNNDIEFWDVSNISDFSGVFFGTDFNQPLNNWNVSSATTMFQMFSRSDFDQDISSWDVSSVIDMYGMFSSSPFNQNIDTWDVSIVRNFSSMFSYNTKFNQPLNSWDVSSALNMNSMFRSASRFNQDISAWDVSIVSNMDGMFSGAIKFDQNISTWDVSSVQTFKSMFSYAARFNQDISTWDVSLANDISFMFNNTVLFNQDISNWDVSNVTTLTAIFQRATNFNQPIGKWNTASLTDLNSAFYFAASFDQNIGTWDISGVNSFNYFFLGNSGMSSVNYDTLLIGWEAQSYQNNLTFDMQGMEYCDGTVARNNLINNGWVFNGDSKRIGCLVTSLTEQKSQETVLNFYPNPAKEYLMLDSDDNLVGEKLVFYDLNSRPIKTLLVQNQDDLISISDLSSGIYFVRIGNKGSKLIVEK